MQETQELAKFLADFSVKDVAQTVFNRAQELF